MKEAVIVHKYDFSKMVMAIQEKAFTTSQKIADYFGKRHDNVLRKIRQVKEECPSEFAALNFEEADFIDKNGEAQPMFKLTKDGYMSVVMGFTDAAATLIKVRYIQAFNCDPDPKSCSIQKQNSGMMTTPLSGGCADEKVAIHRRADCFCPETGRTGDVRT